MKKDMPTLFVEKSNLNYAEHALHKIHHSAEYQQYRRGLDRVQNLEQRYLLANRFREILRAEYELELAIRESLRMIQSLETAGMRCE